MEIRRYRDGNQVAWAAAELFVDAAARSIHARGRFNVALAGGSTPRALYANLAVDPFRKQVDWPNVHLFWGDERCVAPDHADSNYHMARETLIDHVSIPAGNIHRMQGELEPEAAAKAYGLLLKDYFNNAKSGGFDLVLLGMGEDGHTASLFPHTSVLNEMKHRCAAVYVDKLAAWRITLTATMINTAHQICFMVTGENKARTLRDVLRGPHQPDHLPAQSIHPVSGDIIWMVDEPAASLL